VPGAGCPLGHRREPGIRQHLATYEEDEFTSRRHAQHNRGHRRRFLLPEADTAANEFYVNLNTAPFREWGDGAYSFRQVIEGLDVVP